MMHTQFIRMASPCLLALATFGAGASTAPASERPVSLTQPPLVMRLSKDEFRIAFGVDAERAAPDGCSGVIRYRVDWKTEDGVKRSEVKLVSYTVLPRASRAITVDRQYFDTAEAQHTTDVLKVSVEKITCLEAGNARVPQIASAVSGQR
jgi:hypothetical protein